MSTRANIIFADNYHKNDADNLDNCVNQDFDYIKYGNLLIPTDYIINDKINSF